VKRKNCHVLHEFLGYYKNSTNGIKYGAWKRECIVLEPSTMPPSNATYFFQLET
jgi:hypothetical protein